MTLAELKVKPASVFVQEIMPKGRCWACSEPSAFEIYLDYTWYAEACHEHIGAMAKAWIALCKSNIHINRLKR